MSSNIGCTKSSNGSARRGGIEFVRSWQVLGGTSRARWRVFTRHGEANQKEGCHKSLTDINLTVIKA